MQKADVIELLGAENNISKLVGTLNWCVRPKSDRSKDQCPSHLYFKDDKLQAAQKTHGTAYGEDGAKVMNAFFTQMRELQKSGHDSITFDTQEYNSDSLRMRDVRFWVLNKEYTLSVVQGIGSRPVESLVSFSERL